MVVKYLDPYKDDPYGKLRGDKADAYLKINFDEAKVYKAEDAYILAAYVISLQSLKRLYTKISKYMRLFGCQKDRVSRGRLAFSPMVCVRRWTHLL
jgi:hypothetical protein